MGLDGCGKCMKYTMVVANFVILVGGITVMSVGIWTCVDKSSFEKLMGNNLYMSAAYILVATGVIVALISIVGCLGAMRDIKCLLLAYFIILFILFIVMLVGGILGYVFRNEVREKMKVRMQYTMQNEGYMEVGVRDTWDTIQKELKCCGTSIDSKNGTEAWHHVNKLYSGNGQKVPDSCCLLTGEGAVANANCRKGDPPISSHTHTKDCYDAVLEIVDDHSLVLGGVGVGIACVLILGMVFSLILFKTIE